MQFPVDVNYKLRWKSAVEMKNWFKTSARVDLNNLKINQSLEFLGLISKIKEQMMNMNCELNFMLKKNKFKS
jgi:hypothetical protein